MPTFAPSRANANAVALPIPRAPPVTSATLPLRPRSMLPPWQVDRETGTHVHTYLSTCVLVYVFTCLPVYPLLDIRHNRFFQCLGIFGFERLGGIGDVAVGVNDDDGDRI